MNLRGEGKPLDFLGYSFRLDRDLQGRDRKYWNMHPSREALAREREKLRGMADKKRCFQRLPEPIGQINCHLKGWGSFTCERVAQ
ncbi:MAG: hypothetical protein WC076_03655 [Terrimicrobiaceae bacterium]